MIKIGLHQLAARTLRNSVSGPHRRNKAGDLVDAPTMKN